MAGSSITRIVFLGVLFAAGPTFAEDPCEAELNSFLEARSDQISAEQAYGSLQRRFNSESSALSRIAASYDRREARLRYLRSRAIADAVVASALCGIFNSSACRRLSSLSRRISSLQAQLITLSFQESAALRSRRARISRLRSDLEAGRQNRLQAGIQYARTLIALNNCEADV